MKYTRLLLLLVLFLTSCAAPAMPLSTSTFTPEPTAVQTSTPTSTPSPSPTPAYSYWQIISASNATEVTNLYQFDGEVSSLAFSPNGKYLATSFANGAGIIWDISAVKGWNDLDDAPKNIFLAKGNVSFDPESRVLATGGKLIDLSTMKTIQELPGTVVFSPNRNTLASYDWNTVSFWNFDGNQWIMKYKEDTQDVVNVAFSPDGSLLGEAFDWGGGEGVKVRRVADHKLLYTFPLQSTLILLILI